MSMSRNSHEIQLIGNLGGDPEMRYTPSGKPVTSFSMATSSKWTTEGGEKHEQTIWWKITSWGTQAELCNTYLKKGSKIYVKGNIKVDPETREPRIWTTKDGAPRATLEITMEEMKFLDSKTNGGPGDPSPDEPPPGGAEGGTTSSAPEDDIPF